MHASRLTEEPAVDATMTSPFFSSMRVPSTRTRSPRWILAEPLDLLGLHLPSLSFSRLEQDLELPHGVMRLFLVCGLTANSATQLEVDKQGVLRDGPHVCDSALDLE